MASPKPPAWLTESNSVVKLLENPCNAPWMVYAETAIPVIGAAVIRLFTFGMTDVIRGAARPRALRNQSKKGNRGRRGRGGAGIPEVGSLIGKTLGGGEQLEGRKVSDGVKNLWILDGAIQRGLWYWLIADVISDSFYNWSTAIMGSSCGEQPQVGNALCESIENATFFTPGNAWASIPTGLIQYQTEGAFSQFGAHWNSGRWFQGVSAIQAQQALLPGGFIQIGVRLESGEIVPIASGSSGQSQNVIATVEGLSNPQILHYRTNGGSFEGKAYSTTFGF